VLLALLGTVTTVGATAASAAPAKAALRVDHQLIRQDRYTVPVKQWQWAEAWGEIRQFFPRYFKPTATLHLFVRNTAAADIDITTLSFNGKSIEQVCTNKNFAGPVIWYRSNPEVLKPGQMGMIYVRLREAPTEPITLAVTAGDETVTATFDESHRDQIRFGYVGYSQDIDKIYAHVEKWTDAALKLDRIYLDGSDVTAQSELINVDFADGPALVEITLATPLRYGSFHCIKATTKQGPAAMSQVRARDARFHTGLCQGQTALKEYYAKFFNTLYRLHGSHSKTPDWWDANSETAKLGFTVIQPGPTEEAASAGATVPPGRIMYNGVDEPDAHEPGPLPYMSRSGINAMRQVEPPMRIQRRLDPYHDTMILVDRTYAPLQWLHYGELPDVFMHDCYAPTQWMGYDLTVVPWEVQAVTEAVAPRPTHIMLWGNMNTGYPMRRSPTPKENDMSVHYTIAEGAKGLYYFLDWNSYPTIFEGGYYIGAPRTNMLWKNMGRMNAEIKRLESLLTIGHPFQIARSDNKQLYVRSLLCGQDNFVVVMVNRNHRIHISDRATKQPHIFPVEQATVSIDLPRWFKVKSAVHVKWDGTEPVALEGSLFSRTHRLKVNDLMTSMVLVISQDGNIANKLTVPDEQFAALLESEKPTYVTDNAPIADVSRPNTVITLDESALSAGKLSLDLTSADTLAQAGSIKTTGQLRLEPGKWLGLFAPTNWHGESTIVFTVEVPDALEQVTANLVSRTPNFPACANNVIGLSLDGVNYREDCSFKMKWNGHGTLSAKLDAVEGQAIKRFYVRVLLRDPGIVTSDEATNLAERIDLSWTKQ